MNSTVLVSKNQTKSTKTAKTGQGRCIDKADVLRAARGKEIEILVNVAGIPRELLDPSRGHPCPKCGGVDRFRLVDGEAGAARCNQCNPKKCGSYLQVIMWMLGVDFPTALRLVAEYLGLDSTPTTRPAAAKAKPSSGRAGSQPQQSQPPAKPAKPPNPKALELRTWNDTLATLFASKFKPISIDGLKRAHAVMAKHYGQEVVAFPAWGPDLDSQQPIGWAMRRRDGKIFSWKLKDGTQKQAKVKLLYESKNGGICCPDQVRQAETLLVLAGVSDAAAALSLDELPQNWAAWSDSCGELPNPSESLLTNAKDRAVVVVFDSDTTGRTNAGKFANALAAVAKSVKVIDLFPGRASDASGEPKDFRDWLTNGGTATELVAMVEAAAEWEVTELPQKKSKGIEGEKSVLLTLDEHLAATRVIGLLADLDGENEVYQRGGKLVGIVPVIDPDLPPGLKKIKTLEVPTIRERITLAAELFQKVKVGEDFEHRQVPPPKWLVDAVATRGHYPEIKPLAGLIQAPTIRPDGSILQTPGYDRQTGLHYSPLHDFPTVPEFPTREDVVSAAAELVDPFRDFPFAANSGEQSAGESTEAASEPNANENRAAAIAMALTMIGRPCVDGCCPMMVVTGNNRGAGKTKIVDLASMIAYGRPAARERYSPDPEEMGKKITTIAMDARPAVNFDNATGQIGCPALDSAVTAITWRDRILGKTKSMEEVPFKTILITTGNNLTFGSDLARRILTIRLNCQQENPEDRQDFKYPNLLEHVKAIRPRLAVAALTILRGYFSAGCPLANDGTWGSFESWTRVIRGAVVWAGLGDPLNARNEAREQDATATTLGMLIGGLIEAGADQGVGLTAAEICEFSLNVLNPAPSLTAALNEICGYRINPKTIGKHLSQFRERVFDGKKIACYKGRANLNYWRVVSVVTLVSVANPSLCVRGNSNSSIDATCNPYRERGETYPANSPNQPDQDGQSFFFDDFDPV
ncbi:MAG: hypothetical protein KF851_03215 [Pirellulaceae bacterium]|nr:hypothetical protein [Pirellulaceae bacterium]